MQEHYGEANEGLLSQEIIGHPRSEFQPLP